MSRKLSTASVVGVCLVHVLVGYELARVAERTPRRPSTPATSVRELAHGR